MDFEGFDEKLLSKVEGENYDLVMDQDLSSKDSKIN